MTELGEIPNNWEVKKLDEISNITRLAGAEYSDIWETDDIGTIIALKGNNIGKNNLILNDIERITEEMSNRLIRSKLFKNDIVFPCVGTIGKATVINEDNKYHINQNIAKITPSSGINSLYLSYYLMSDFTVKEIFKYNTSSSQPNVLVGNLRKFNIIVPSTEEQEKIASILSIVDEQIDNVDALIEKNKELKKGLMQTLLTKGIGHTKFKKTEIGEVPSEWYIKSIDEITKEVYRYPTYYGIEYVEEGIAEIRGELLNDDASIKKESFRYISEKTAKKFPRTKLEGGDIVISVRGTIGKVGYITEELAGSNITANLLRVSMNRNIMNEHFVKQLFLSDIMKRKFDEITTATTIKTFKVPEFKQIILAIPTKDEQDKIASILLEVDKKIEEHENKKQKLEELKKGLMQQLLTGRIRV